MRWLFWLLALVFRQRPDVDRVDALRRIQSAEPFVKPPRRVTS